MASSRKSARADSGQADRHFERALEAILARVFVSAAAGPKRIGIASSGGLDSSVLLHCCAAYASRHPAVVFHAFHVHHGLSPNADDWEAHCRRAAAEGGIAYASAKVALARDDQRGTEEAARTGRYAALGALCRERGIPLLLTAQHRDDQAETFLLQLFRGAGLRGLSGMAAIQAPHPLLGPDVALGRPLLGWTRAALEACACEAGLAHVDDESNRELRYRRNALRREILPAIGAHFPGAPAAIARSARHLQSAQGLLDDLARIDRDACAAPGDPSALDVAALHALSRERVENLLRQWLQSAGIRPPSAARLADLRAQLLDAGPDLHLSFTFGPWQLTRYRGCLRLRCVERFDAPPPCALRWRGEAALAVPAWRGRMVFEAAQGPGLPRAMLEERTLRVTGRMGGERIRQASGRPSKTLKSLYQEAGIEPWQRARLPLVYAGDDLVFAAGIGIDMRYAVAADGIALRWEARAPESDSSD